MSPVLPAELPPFTDRYPPFAEYPFGNGRFHHTLAERNDEKLSIMKTLIESLTAQLTIYSGLLLLIAGISLGANFVTNPPVDNPAAVEFPMEEELNVDDIPFNTREVAENYELMAALNVPFEMEEESYVDDIPFDTEAVATGYRMREHMNLEFDFEEEAYIDDIPFNTFSIAVSCSDNMVSAK